MTINVMAFLILMLTAISCTTSSGLMGRNPENEIAKICLNLDGNGRLGVQGHKYVFSAETMLDEEHNKWIMGMNFSLHGQELIELDLSGDESFFKEKVQERILRENAGVNPERLELFMQRWAELIKEIIHYKKGENRNSNFFEWSVENKKLIASTKVAEKNVLTAEFYNIENGAFSRMDFLLDTGESASEIKVELIVRKCLDNQ